MSASAGGARRRLDEEYYGDHYGAMHVADEVAEWTERQPEYTATAKMLSVIRATNNPVWLFILGRFHDEQGFPETTP